MSSFKDAVDEMNRRFRDGGWCSSYAPQLACPECGHEGAILTSIRGTTKATCGSETCRHRWEL
jgi:hypothetical protein